jgi:hypothetical protein
MIIDSVKSPNEPESVLQLANAIFPQLEDDGSKYNHDFWIGKMNERPELLLYAKDGDVVCGTVLACDGTVNQVCLRLPLSTVSSSRNTKRSSPGVRPG